MEALAKELPSTSAAAARVCCSGTKGTDSGASSCKQRTKTNGMNEMYVGNAKVQYDFKKTSLRVKSRECED